VCARPTSSSAPTQAIPAVGLSRDAAAAAYDDDRLGFLLDMARRHGPAVQLWPGTILVTGPAEVDEILRRTYRDFNSDRNFRNRKIDLRMGSPELTDWLTARRAALAAMTPRMIADHMAWLAPRADAFTVAWLSRCRVSRVTPDLEALTAASITRFCFGTRDAAEVPAAAQRMLDALFPIFDSPFEYPGYIRALQPREWRVRRDLRGLHAVLRSVLARRGAGGLADVVTGAGLGETATTKVLTSVHLAAHGVPASALTWALIELARNPKEQAAAAAAAATWDGSGAAPDQIGWLVDETLRLWPPSWLSERVTDMPVSCGPWTMPAKSRLVMPSWVIHRTAGCFPDPERFVSARWAAGPPPPPGAYLPFGGGPRWCLGARFARAELTTFLTVLLRRARIAVHGDVRADARRTLTPVGFELEFRPR
jgi:cytochrome P450